VGIRSPLTPDPLAPLLTDQWQANSPTARTYEKRTWSKRNGNGGFSGQKDLCVLLSVTGINVVSAGS